jgi:plastocyanin
MSVIPTPSTLEARPLRRARLFALLIPLALSLAGPALVVAAGHTVRITSTLDPAHLTIAPGDTVTFRNDDDERHRMRSRSEAAEFDTGDLEPGESFRVRFNTTGTFSYLDERNDDLQRYWGTIVVSDGATAEPTDDGSGDGSAGGTTGGGTGGSTAPSATIRIADRLFSPRQVTIAAGGTVTWRNEDDRDHTATATGGAFNSGNLAQGASYRKQFDTAGTFPFLCALHPEMTGTVTVTGVGGSGAGATPKPAATPKLTPTPPAGSGAASRPPTRETVEIVDLDFQPGEIEVAAGGSVTWTNTGVAPHTATADDGAFDSRQLDSGERFTQTFASPGRFAYACAIHPSMTGVVVVRATSGAAATAAPAVGPSPAPTASPSQAPPGEGPAAAAGEDPAPPASAGSAVAGATEAAAAPGPAALGLVSTLLALALIVGALMVGAGLVLGMDRRGSAIQPTR